MAVKDKGEEIANAPQFLDDDKQLELPVFLTKTTSKQLSHGCCESKGLSVSLGAETDE